jgi:hypothetical protein
MGDAVPAPLGDVAEFDAVPAVVVRPGGATVPETVVAQPAASSTALAQATSVRVDICVAVPK